MDMPAFCQPSRRALFALAMVCTGTLAVYAAETKDAKATKGAKDAAPAKAITYTKHIAPILWKNCAGCHRPGEIGPFSLLTYEDASKRADFIAEITGDRRMPPWKAEPDFGKFHDECRLTDREIDLIAKWAEAGAAEARPRICPKNRSFPRAGNWASRTLC